MKTRTEWIEQQVAGVGWMRVRVARVLQPVLVVDDWGRGVEWEVCRGGGRVCLCMLCTASL